MTVQGRLRLNIGSFRWWDEDCFSYVIKKGDEDEK